VKAQVRTSFTARTVGKIDESHLMSGDQLEAIRMLTLCRGRDYAGEAQAVPAPQPVHGHHRGIISVVSVK